MFYYKKINIETTVNNKTKKAINLLCRENGVFLLNSISNEIYLVFDGSYVNLNGEAPYFSDTNVKTKEDTIMIYFCERLKKYPIGKYPEQKSVYKITTDKCYNYIRLFKNGIETHFDSAG